MTQCLIECTPIPDGFMTADASRLRLSVLLRPLKAHPAAPHSGPLVDMQKWPTQVPGLKFQVWAGSAKDSLEEVATIPAEQAFEAALTPSISPHAQQWWDALWTDPNDLAAYVDLLNGGGSNIETQPEAKINGYDYAQLHEAAVGASLHELGRAAYAFEALSSVKYLAGEFDGLTLRAARDPNDPLVRIARCLHQAEQSGAGFVARPDDVAGEGMSKSATLDDEFARALNPQASEPILWSQPPGGAGFMAKSRRSITDNNDAFEEAMKTDGELGAEADALDPKFEYAHQVIGALQAHPALRKFARQIADLPIDAERLRAVLGKTGTELKGVLAVEMISPGETARAAPSAAALFTAFVLRGGQNALFEPCPLADFAPAGSVAPAPDLRDGFVLPQTVDGTRRFQIASIDGIAAYYARKRSDEATLEAYLGGAETKDVPTEPTGFRTRGLMLLDVVAKETAEEAEKRQTAIASERLLFAEDLTDGYRVDVLAPNGAVFPACARTVDYGALDALSADLRQPYISHRNDGYVAPLARTWIIPSADPSRPADRFLSVSQVMLTWTGRPLGLQAGEQPESLQASGESTLLNARYGFDRTRPGPILRQFGHYRFVLRARKLNGSSVALSQPRAAEFALGSQNDKLGWGLLGEDEADPGYEFGFVEKAPAPTVLVDDAFKPGSAVDPADRENIATVLVSTGSAETKVRWLASPITGFELAELQSQLDPPSSSAGDRARAERRARFGAYRYLFHEANGSFPTLKDGTAAVALALRPTAPSSSPPALPHFVDATLRTVAARLTARKATPAQALETTALKSDPAFFPAPAKPSAFEPDDVVPVRVEVRAVGISGKSRVRNGPDYRLKVPGPGGRTLVIPTICVDVAPADTLELELWCNKTDEAFNANPAVAPFTAGAKANNLKVKSLFAPEAASDRKKRAAFLRTQRVASLSDATTLRIEHPVVKPLLQPKVLTPLRVFRAADKKAWEELIRTGNGSDQPNAAKIFTTGRLSLDRKSSGEVWAEAFWIEAASKDRVFRTSAPENLARVEQTGLYRRETPTQFRRLFELPPLALPPPSGGEDPAAYLRRVNEVDLLLEDSVLSAAGASSVRTARSLSADFDCDQHRTLAVRIVARSRFAPAAAAADPDDTEAASALRPEDATYLSRSATREACRAAIETGAWSPGVYKIVMPATRRPPPPHLTRDKGTLYQRELRVSSDGSESSLVHIYRCWLDGDWFASGDGERLAVVCRKPRAAPLPDWADAQVSRWGGDTASEPGQKLWVMNDLSEADATYLLARQIGEAVEEEASLWRNPEDNSVAAQVALACLEPKFHDGFGRWYCDIELKPTGAFKALIKLMLARFQKDALPGRQLSSTVPVDAVMLHQPWRFSARRTGSTVAVTVTGPAYQGRAPMLDKMAGVSQGSTVQMLSELIGETQAAAMDALPQSPLLVAELERLDEHGKGPMPALSGGRAVVATSLGVAPQNISEKIEGLSQPIMLKRWTLSLEIPGEDSGKPLAVRVSLASAHANSQARDGRTPGFGTGRDGAAFQPSALDGPLIFLPEPIVVQLKLPAK